MKKTTNKYSSDVLTNTNSIVKIPRNTFGVPHKHQTAFNGGKLIPLDCIECYPGDTIRAKVGSLITMTNQFIKAPMGELEFGMYFFKVPMRICLEDFEEIIGNYNPMPDWTTDNENLIPGLIIPEKGGFAVGSVADYFGLPVLKSSTNSQVKKVSRLPINAYIKIGDEWFRDEDLMNTAGVNTANVDVQGVGTADGDYLTDAVAGGALYPVCKLKAGDPFTTARPGVQKGAPVVIGLAGNAPVVFSGSGTPLYAPVGVKEAGQDSTFYPYGMRLNGSSEGILSREDLFYNTDRSRVERFVHNFMEPWHSNPTQDPLITTTKDTSMFANLQGLTGAYADMSQVLAVSIADLRLSWQLQKIKELNGLYGNRYPELLSGRWGVRCADGRLQRPEYLGSQKFTLSVNRSIQTSGSTQELGGTAQGNIAAYSVTSKSGYVFETSCVEHCYIIAVGCVRIKHRPYPQGIPHLFLNRGRDDFYQPELANISPQPIKNCEIYYGGNEYDHENFGYKEAWWNLRIIPNKVTGLMRPDVPESLAIWNFSDNYASTPTLSAEWVIEDMAALDRALTIPSTTQPSFLADFLFDYEMTRPLPIHSYPGLVDHQWGFRS